MTSASDRTTGFLRGLHPVTQLLVVAALVHLGASLFVAAVSLAEPTLVQQTRPLLVRVAEQLHTVSYSIMLFGTAATVEFLFRIWNELRLARKPD